MTPQLFKNRFGVKLAWVVFVLAILSCDVLPASAQNSNSKVLIDAKLSAHVYDANNNIMGKAVPALPEYELVDFEDRGTGLQAGAYRNDRTRELKVVFRGTDDGRDLLDDVSLAGGQVFPSETAMHKGDPYPTGSNSARFEQRASEAAAFTDRVRSDPNNVGFQLSFSGHSLGGALAQVEAARTNLPARTFNAPGVKNIVARLYPGSSCANVENHIREHDAVVGALRDLCGGVTRYEPAKSDQKHPKTGMKHEVTQPFHSHFIDQFIRDLEGGLRPLHETPSRDSAIDDILSSVIEKSDLKRAEMRSVGSAASRGLSYAASDAAASIDAGEGSTHDSSDSLAAAQGAFQSSLNSATAARSAYLESNRAQCQPGWFQDKFGACCPSSASRGTGRASDGIICPASAGRAWFHSPGNSNAKPPLAGESDRRGEKLSPAGPSH